MDASKVSYSYGYQSITFVSLKMRQMFPEKNAIIALKRKLNFFVMVNTTVSCLKNTNNVINDVMIF